MTKYIPGDVVKTKWGNAVILQSNPEYDHVNMREPEWHEIPPDWPCSYSVEHLPGYIERIWEVGIGHGPKHAWYDKSELEMVAPSAARGLIKLP